MFPSYSLSPEARYPTALEECYAVLQRVADDGADKGLGAARIAIAGDSAGGNMTAALTLMAKERSGPSLVAQLLFYPVTNASFDTDPYREFAKCTTEEAQRDEITASPLRATTEELVIGRAARRG